MVELLQNCAFADRLTILEQDAGLHFLLKVDTTLSDGALCEKLAGAGIRIHPISHYYHTLSRDDTHLLVVNYASLDEDILERLLTALPEKL